MGEMATSPVNRETGACSALRAVIVATRLLSATQRRPSAATSRQPCSDSIAKSVVLATRRADSAVARVLHTFKCRGIRLRISVAQPGLADALWDARPRYCRPGVADRGDDRRRHPRARRRWHSRADGRAVSRAARCRGARRFRSLGAGPCPGGPPRSPCPPSPPRGKAWYGACIAGRDGLTGEGPVAKPQDGRKRRIAPTHEPRPRGAPVSSLPCKPE